MASTEFVTYACDFDLAEIPAGGHVSRLVSVDGRSYEVHLCGVHGVLLDGVLGRLNRVRSPRQKRSAAARQRSADIRAWAKREGVEVGDLGRIPADVIAMYDARRELASA